MEPIVGSLVEPRSRWRYDTHKRPAEESRLDHDRLDESDLPASRSRHRARPADHPGSLERLRPFRGFVNCVREVGGLKSGECEKKKRNKNVRAIDRRAYWYYYVPLCPRLRLVAAADREWSSTTLHWAVRLSEILQFRSGRASRFPFTYVLYSLHAVNRRVAQKRDRTLTQRVCSFSAIWRRIYNVAKCRQIVRRFSARKIPIGMMCIRAGVGVLRNERTHQR